jgi:hypothetical protein
LALTQFPAGIVESDRMKSHGQGAREEEGGREGGRRTAEVAG